MTHEAVPAHSSSRKAPMLPGDHLVSPRIGYSHHGLYIGGGRVIHYAGLNDLRSRERVRVEEVSLSEFTRGRGCSVREHPQRRYSPAQSIRRARSRLGENLYSLVTNNCEHFVNWCIDGEHRSEQVETGIRVVQTLIDHYAGREAKK